MQGKLRLIKKRNSEDTQERNETAVLEGLVAGGGRWAVEATEAQVQGLSLVRSVLGGGGVQNCPQPNWGNTSKEVTFPLFRSECCRLDLKMT